MTVNWLQNRIITSNELLASVMWTIRKEIVASKNMPRRFVVYALFICAYFEVTSITTSKAKRKSMKIKIRMTKYNTFLFLWKINRFEVCRILTIAIGSLKEQCFILLILRMKWIRVIHEVNVYHLNIGATTMKRNNSNNAIHFFNAFLKLSC